MEFKKLKKHVMSLNASFVMKTDGKGKTLVAMQGRLTFISSISLVVPV